MLTQLLKIVTPELIEQAVKNNPNVIIEVLQRFETFKLLGNALTHEQQIIVSNNSKYIKSYLVTEDGKDSARIWADGFASFVNKIKAGEDKLQQDKLDERTAVEEARIKVLEDIRQKDIDRVTLAIKEAENIRTRLALEASMRAEMELRIRKEIEEKMRSDVIDVEPKQQQ